MLISGLGIGCFMMYFPAFLSKKKTNNAETTSNTLGLGLIIALSLSILFRTLNSSIDLSSYSWFQIIGWILGGLEVILMLRYYNDSNKEELMEESMPPSPDSNSDEQPRSNGQILGIIFGISSIFLLINFVFNGTTVLARWTEGNYMLITIGIIVILFLFAIILISKPELIFNLKSYIILIWNGLFVLFLVVTIAINQVSFPSTLDLYPIVVSQPTFWQFIPLGLLMLLMPVIFIDFILLIRQLIHYKPTLPKLALGFTFGGGFYTLLTVFAIIFTSTWGFVGSVSLFFRDGFWFVFLFIGLIAGLSILLV